MSGIVKRVCWLGCLFLPLWAEAQGLDREELHRQRALEDARQLKSIGNAHSRSVTSSTPVRTPSSTGIQSSRIELAPIRIVAVRPADPVEAARQAAEQARLQKVQERQQQRQRPVRSSTRLSDLLAAKKPAESQETDADNARVERLKQSALAAVEETSDEEAADGELAEGSLLGGMFRRSQNSSSDEEVIGSGSANVVESAAPRPGRGGRPLFARRPSSPEMEPLAAFSTEGRTVVAEIGFSEESLPPIEEPVFDPPPAPSEISDESVVALMVPGEERKAQRTFALFVREPAETPVEPAPEPVVEPVPEPEPEPEVMEVAQPTQTEPIMEDAPQQEPEAGPRERRGLLGGLFAGRNSVPEVEAPVADTPAADATARSESRYAQSSQENIRASGSKDYHVVINPNSPFHVFDVDPSETFLVELDQDTIARVKGAGKEWTWLQLHTGLMGVMRNHHMRPARKSEIMQYLAMEQGTRDKSPVQFEVVELDLPDLPTVTRKDNTMPLGHGLLPPIDASGENMEVPLEEDGDSEVEVETDLE